MFRHIFLFELKYRLRRPATYIYFLIMALTGLLYASILGGAFGPEVAGLITGGGKNLANSPYNLHQLIFSLAQIPGTFIIAAIMAVPVYRDFQYDAHSLFFTKPLTKNGYLGARYLGSLVVTLLVLFGLVVGFMLVYLNPKIEPDRFGPFNLLYYLYPFLLGVVPYTLIAGTIFFATVSLTRNQLLIYLNALVLLVLFSVASAASQQIENKFVASLIDPSGSAAFIATTETWTVAERNSQLLPINAEVGFNLLIWLSVAGLILFFTFRRFQLVYQTGGNARLRVRKRPLPRSLGDTVTLKSLKLPPVHPVFSQAKSWKLLGLHLRQELRYLFRSPIFWVIAVVAVLFAILGLTFGARTFGTPTLPVTYSIAGQVMGTLGLFIYALLIFYSGEMIWRERSLNLAQITDTLPVPNWTRYLAKMIALALVPVLLHAGGILVGVGVQLGKGFFDIDLGHYVVALLGFGLIDYLLFLPLAFLVQVLSPNKFVGFVLVVVIFFFNASVLGLLGVEHNMLEYMSNTRLSYSDMNGYGHFVWPYLSFKLYWLGLAIVMAVVGLIFWPRGTESGRQARAHAWQERFTGPARLGMVAGLLLFLGTGSYIFYNTNVLNTYRNSKEEQKLRAEFEKQYKQYQDAPQPRITGIELDVDLYPEKRSFDASGVYRLRNKTGQPIDSVHVLLTTDVDLLSLTFAGGSERVLNDSINGYRIYRLAQTLAPGDSIEMRFAQRFAPEGFPNSGSNTNVVYNGTFISQTYFPQLGYNPQYELTDLDLRKKYDLPPNDRFPAITDTAALANTLIARDADWIDFEARVSTAPDQIAVVPGYLQREWEENGRRHFHYKMDSKMLKFFAIVSARYEVLKDSWQAPDGREISLEIYHHPSHGYNTDKMMAALKDGLAYYTSAFSPYQHRQVRILEFPRYAGFAQSFANTIPYSEAVGFIADVDEGDVDYPYYITAHELAHQWWAHQVIGGNVQGFQFLSETMAQYASLMVMKEKFGEEGIRKYLRYELDNYLTGRTTERRREMPALLSENQLYIHYNKGSLISYALQDYIGEDSLNAALSRYIDSVAFQDAPYTTTLEWLAEVEKVVPDSLRYVVEDMFRTITLYDNEVTEATYAPTEEGRYEVTLQLNTRKWRDDGTGEEQDIPIGDYIDIGVFGQTETDGKTQDTTLYLKKHLIGPETKQVTVFVDQEPKEAGIDPLYKLIDREPKNNTERVERKGE